MFAAYLNEEENLETIKKDFGFISYRIANGECFIAHFFVDKPYRGDLKYSFELETLVREEAIKNKCKVMTCNVFVSLHTKVRSTKLVNVYSRFGFQIDQVFKGQILMVKQL